MRGVTGPVPSSYETRRGRTPEIPAPPGALVTAFLAGRTDEAQRWHRKLFPLCRDMLGVATNPIPVKAAMKLLGRGTGELRLPMTALEAAGEAKVRKTLQEYGLL